MTEVSPRFATVERAGRLTIVTINRPEAANALHPDASWELGAIFDDFAADPDQWVAILTGAGTKTFCAGTDLKFRAEHGRKPLPAGGFGGLTARFDLEKPIIAAVNGDAFGGGFELVLACDLIIASESAKFALREVRHGLAALAGGIHRLARQLPQRIASELILTGRDLPAKEAHALNLINAVVPQDEMWSEARRWADLLLDLAPLAMRASKQVMMRGLDEEGLAEAMRRQDEYPAVIAMRGSDDAQEGARAFLEKRKPRWRGE